MRSALGPSPRSRAGQGPALPDFTIPYEHDAVFDITGQPGNIVQDVVTVGPEGVFVAVAVGYGFEEERGRALKLAIGGAPTAPLPPGDVTLGDIPALALIEGFRLNAGAHTVLLKPPNPAVPRRGSELTTQALPKPWLQESLLERVKPGEEIAFLFSMLDSATGRELQDEPAHNLASLGKSNGERPFRPLARPLSFLPRSTLRVQVVEQSEGVTGRLHVVLFGYKILGASLCPESLLRQLPPPPRRASAPAVSPDRLIPFDYVMKFLLSGRPGNRVADEIVVNVEGGFVAEYVGYGLEAGTQRVPFLSGAMRALSLSAGAAVSLPSVPLKAFPTAALVAGIRLRADMLRVAFRSGGGGALEPNFPPDFVDDLFESLNRPDDVSFLYSFFDGGSGRELQNRPIHNVAGLGIANGDRPFKRLGHPMVFLPRSTLRAEIEERFGRGTLYLAFQGYRAVGSPAAGTLR